MLSRTADHLYWMARYMERAENLARMLDTSYRTSLLPQTEEETATNWGRLLQIMDIEAQYFAKNSTISPEAKITARCMTFSNSRTFPGQPCPSSAACAAGERRRPGRPERPPCSARKCCAKGTISSGR